MPKRTYLHTTGEWDQDGHTLEVRTYPDGKIRLMILRGGDFDVKKLPANPRPSNPNDAHFMFTPVRQHDA